MGKRIRKITYAFLIVALFTGIKYKGVICRRESS